MVGRSALPDVQPMYVVTVEFTIDLTCWDNFSRLMLENAARTAVVIAHPGASRIIFHELQQPTDFRVNQEVRALL